MSVVYINPFSFYDTDAQVYISAVEAADGQGLEDGVKNAINSFVIGCKADGIWTAIKASCILAGARTLSGALVPLVGTAPTNNNFVSGDYNRETGLVGNGTTKYLNSNRSNNADPQNSNHNVVYLSSVNTSRTEILIGSTSNGSVGENLILNITGTWYLRSRLSDFGSFNAAGTIGFFGHSRSGATAWRYRRNGTTTLLANASQSPNAVNLAIFSNNAGTDISTARISFYSIGESLDLALLDARVTELINAYAAAIP
jgi:hypothetical protein